jgi:hypothetical protein
MKTLLSMTMALALGAGCAGDQELPPEGVDVVDAELVAEIQRDNGNTLAIYEHAPGQWFYVESGLAPTVADAERLDDFFRAAAPGHELPAAITAAQARADALQLWDTDVVSEVGGSAPGGDTVEAPATGARLNSNCQLVTFILQHCNGGDDQAWCKTSWANSITWYNTSANYMSHAVCALEGNVTLRLFVDSAPAGSWTVSQGGFRKISKIQQPIYLPVPPFYLANRFGFVTDVVNASGDRFMSGGGSGDH